VKSSDLKEIKANYVVLEHLPWLKQPRIVMIFDNLEEASIEASKLNQCVFTQSFFSYGELIITYQYGLERPPRVFSPVLFWG